MSLATITATKPAAATHLGIRSAPRLTPDEEKSLALIVQDGLAADPANPADADRIAAGREAEDRFFRANLGFVTERAASLTRGRPIEFDDAWSLAALGVIEAIRRFDPSADRRFTTYAGWWVEHHVRRGTNDAVNRIRIPVWMLDRLRREKRDAEAGVEFKPHRYGGHARGAMKWEAIESGDSHYELAERTEPDDDGRAERIRVAVETAVDRLDPDGRDVVSTRFGLGVGGKPEGPEKYARRTGQTRKVVRVRYEAAAKVLRIALRDVAGEIGIETEEGDD